MTAADLSPIELENLRGFLAGKTCAQVAVERDRSKKTVEDQLRWLRMKVGVNNNVQLGAWAERHGIRVQA